MEYRVTSYLSSIEFYRMISDLNTIMSNNDQIIIDLSEVKRIDGNVIPNLILMGTWIEERTKLIPVIRLGRTFEAGYLKKFLYNIRFYQYSQNVYIFEDENEKYCGFEGKDMDKRNITIKYSFPFNEYNECKKDSKQKFRNKVGEDVKNFVIQDSKDFLYYYFQMFNYGSEEEKTNRLSDILGQVVGNSMSKGISDAYLSMQANYNKKKIVIATSDRGRGMLEAMCFNRSKDNTDPLGYFLFDRNPNNEEEAIIESITYRKDSNIYGLHHAILEIIEKWNGTVRIHSNNTQLILTKNAAGAYKNLDLLNYFNDYNMRKTVTFPGTHFEIEIPMG